MPSGNYNMSTGSDTRMYNPRSESSHMYTANSEDEESFRHGIGDPESMERYRDKLQSEKEGEVKVTDLPHIRLQTVEPQPEMPMDMDEEQPIMDDDNENAVGAEISQMTGMPGQGGPNVSQAMGAQVNQPFGLQTIATGEPMENAWSSLLKRHEPWHQPRMETTPFGRGREDKISEIRSKVVASRLGHPAEKGGLNESKLALHRGHRQTTQPQTAFPERYQQTLGRQDVNRLLGGIKMPKGMQPRPMRGERPTPSSKQLDIKEPSMKLASIEMLKSDVANVRKKMNYMQFNQLRRLLRQIKDKVDDKRLKMADPGDIGEAGPGNGLTGTSPQGGTESIQSDEVQTGSRVGKVFGYGRKGSGRSA